MRLYTSVLGDSGSPETLTFFITHLGLFYKLLLFVYYLFHKLLFLEPNLFIWKLICGKFEPAGMNV